MELSSNPSLLSRRGFAHLAVLGLVAGAGVLGSTPAAATDGQVHYDRANRLAGQDPVLRAIASALHPDAEYPGELPAPPPTRLFDDLAVLSVGFVHAMALFTDEGIVLFDALRSPQDGRDFIEPGLRELGADPGDIRYIVVTHGHYDHFGAARYLADRHGARVMMSPADWDLIERTNPDDAPDRDLEIADGQRLTLGDTSIALHHTPGHTSGTVSPIFPVHTGTRRHKAMLWGGSNPPETTGELRDYIDSIDTFRWHMRGADVDVELSNHPNDHGLQRIQRLRDDPGGPNPFLLGRARADRYMRVMDLMLRGRLADARSVQG